jgi:hypothetical protein
MFRKLLRISALALVALFFTVVSAADTIGPITQSSSFTGSFSADNDEQVFSLDLTSYSLGALINLHTSSFGAGGFAPELTLFFPGGFPPLSDGQGSDASISGQTLSAGMWTFVLTQSGNDSLGNSLGDGFSQDANNGNDAHFTADNAGLCDPADPGSCNFLFVQSLSLRTGDWAVNVDVNPVSAVSPVPEPSSAVLMLTGILAAATILNREKLTFSRVRVRRFSKDQLLQ